METEKISIRHTFTDGERLELGEEQARLLMKQDELEAQLKSAKTQIQAQIDAAEAETRAISSKLRDRAEFRNVECLILDHRINGMHHVVRMDSGHVVKARKLRPEECQQTLTTEPPKEFIAIALCPVDDQAVEAELIELKIVDDEFEVLRKCPDVKLRDMPKAISEKKEPKPKK
jgi:hypothetical protein